MRLKFPVSIAFVTKAIRVHILTNYSQSVPAFTLVFMVSGQHCRGAGTVFPDFNRATISSPPTLFWLSCGVLELIGACSMLRSWFGAQAAHQFGLSWSSKWLMFVLVIFNLVQLQWWHSLTLNTWVRVTWFFCFSVMQFGYEPLMRPTPQVLGCRVHTFSCPMVVYYRFYGPNLWESLIKLFAAAKCIYYTPFHANKEVFFISSLFSIFIFNPNGLFLKKLYFLSNQTTSPWRIRTC